jgi:hypothetical protein
MDAVYTADRIAFQSHMTRHYEVIHGVHPLFEVLQLAWLSDFAAPVRDAVNADIYADIC